jgi:hypothetical protein
MSTKAISEHLPDFDSLTDADVDAAMSSSPSRRFTQSKEGKSLQSRPCAVTLKLVGGRTVPFYASHASLVVYPQKI